MKRIILLLVAVFSLIGCSNQEEINAEMVKKQEETIAALEVEIAELQNQKEGLVKEIENIKVDSGTAKYIITLEIKQNHYLDLEKMIKDEMNAIEIELPVDKEFFDSVEEGDVLDDSFRLGSLLLEGSWGNWKISIIDKEIR